MIKRCFAVEENGWLDLRTALWPHSSREAHLSEMARWCADQDRYAAFIAREASGQAVGFAEASIRFDYVNGTDTSPVGFLEGLFVSPGYRHQGIAGALVFAVERWVASSGCRELASDVAIGNIDSLTVHKSLGFEETERVVFFRKRLGGG